MSILALAVAVALAAPSLIGIELGKPLNAPACPSDPILFFAPDRSTCQADTQGSSTEFWMHLANGHATYLGGEPLVTVRDNSVEEISVQTLGIYGQDEALAALEVKFGKPTSLARPVMQNGFGATYRTIRARWVRAAYVVTYTSALDVDHGEIHLMTTAEASRRAADQRPRSGL
jgi:hypothetical protein